MDRPFANVSDAELRAQFIRTRIQEEFGTGSLHEDLAQLDGEGLQALKLETLVLRRIQLTIGQYQPRPQEYLPDQELPETILHVHATPTHAWEPAPAVVATWRKEDRQRNTARFVELCTILTAGGARIYATQQQGLYVVGTRTGAWTLQALNTSDRSVSISLTPALARHVLSALMQEVVNCGPRQEQALVWIKRHMRACLDNAVIDWGDEFNTAIAITPDGSLVHAAWIAVKTQDGGRLFSHNDFRKTPILRLRSIVRSMNIGRGLRESIKPPLGRHVTEGDVARWGIRSDNLPLLFHDNTGNAIASGQHLLVIEEADIPTGLPFNGIPL